MTTHCFHLREGFEVSLVRDDAEAFPRGRGGGYLIKLLQHDGLLQPPVDPQWALYPHVTCVLILSKREMFKCGGYVFIQMDEYGVQTTIRQPNFIFFIKDR